MCNVHSGTYACLLRCLLCMSWSIYRQYGTVSSYLQSTKLTLFRKIMFDLKLVYFLIS